MTLTYEHVLEDKVILCVESVHNQASTCFL